MKKIFLVFVIFFCLSSANGAELFYNNGTSIFIEKSEEFVAVKTPASKAVPDKDAVYSLNTGSNVYSFVSSTGKKGGDELPVYFLGDMPAVAERTVFWRGEKPVEEMEKKYGMELTEIFQTYPLYSFSVKGDSVEISERIVNNGDGYAFPDFVREAPAPTDFVPGSEPEDPYFDMQWHLSNTGRSGLKNADIKFRQMLEFLNSKKIKVNPDIKIAIMDSGVSRDHEDLKITAMGYDTFQDGEVLGGGTPNVYLLEGENVNNETKSSVLHGTECAGVSAEIGNQTGMSGVCPWCWIYPVRYPISDSYSNEESGGTGITGNTILKIYEKYVSDSNISVVNCSFGPNVSVGIGYVFPSTAAGIQNFMQNGRGGKGGVVVYSSGNDNVDSSYKRLLEYDFVFEREGVGVVTNRVVTVNATTSRDIKTHFSNYGYTSTVAAPGSDLGTTMIPGYGDYYKSDGTLDSNYTFFSGTSAAAPVVSGLFGVLFSINPGLTLEEAMEILKRSADKINPETGFWDENGFSVKYGYGRVNLEKAVRLARGYTMCAEVKEEECGNHLDDDCDGYVDEGCAEELTAGQPCENDAECLTSSLSPAYVSCVTELLSWVFKGGYCFRRLSPCPDGTQKLGDIKEHFKYFCALECNSFNPCTRPGYYCTDEVLGVCLPLCSDNSDCANGAVCNENGHCVSKCGNGVVDDGEECDDGEDNGKKVCEYGKQSCTVCSATCEKDEGTKSYCGDERIDVRNGEKCDDGNYNGKYGHCNTKCSGLAAHCGDGNIDSANGEKCDYGTANGKCAYGETSCRTCTTSCNLGEGKTSYCGDQKIDATNGEACDDGNKDDGDYCSSDCHTVTGRCGDGTIQSNEECDEGEDNGGTDCAYGETSCSVCTSECKTAAGLTSYCGDGNTDETNGEVCDRGSGNGETNCLYGETECVLCTVECQEYQGIASFCGDGNIDTANGEACDNASDNGIVNCAYGEKSCNVCTAECQTAAGITSYCGDGIIDADNNEICDAGVDNGTDGLCNSTCDSRNVQSDNDPISADEEAVETDDSSEEPLSDEDVPAENEKKKNGGGCSVLAV